MNNCTVKKQQGAVTLIGAMFLIVSVAIMLAAAQRIAGSSITDSALHRDGIQALFIAESGLEHATWRYSGGTACTALSGDSGDIGSGNFTVHSASMVDAQCRVRVIGSVTTTSVENAVNRIIEGDLTAASSGSANWVVGADDNNEMIIQWDGSNWSRESPYSGIPDRELYSVHCVASDDCWAVGDNDGYNGGELIIHWDGSNWSRVGPYSGIPNSELYSVHCVANDDCWAVGEDYWFFGGELIIHWDGNTWSRVGVNFGIWGSGLYSVHCVASDDCWAVGDDRNNGGELIVHWDGSNWSRVGPFSGIPNRELYSVHCVASDDCWAVGEDDRNNRGELIIHWDGITWSRAGPYPGVPNRELHSVHCVASDNCWTVGERSGYENINHWNGTTWTRIRNTSSIANVQLNSVHMVSASEGYIVGQDGTMAVWDGNDWVGQSRLTNEDLFAVTGYVGASGGVELVRWSEVIQ